MLHTSAVQSNTLLSQDYQTFMNNKLFALPPVVCLLKRFPKHYSSTISSAESGLEHCQAVLTIVTLDMLFFLIDKLID